MCIDTMNTEPKQSETRARSYLHFSVMFLLKKSKFPHRIVSNRKHSQPLTNADQNSLETVFCLQSVACSMSDGYKKNYDSNYFWSIIVDNIDVFDCAYKVWFCCMLHDVTVDIFLEMFLLERKVF